MNETARLADQLDRALRGDAWAGPSLLALLKRVSPESAWARPLPSAHTIWELVLHVTVWKEIALRRLERELVVDVPEAENWPAPPARPAAVAWQRTLQQLAHAHDELLTAVSALSEARLDDLVPGKDHSLYVMLQGVAQHDLYHAGQIALLLKAG